MFGFRSEVLLDIMLSATAVLLILLLLQTSQPAAGDHFRHATAAVGCFAADNGGAWNGRYRVYRRDDGGTGKGWRLVGEPDEAQLFTSLKTALAPDRGYSRVAIMVDFHGAACARPGRGAGERLDIDLRSITDVTGFRGWVVDRELIPCRDRSFCEALLGVKTGAAGR